MQVRSTVCTQLHASARAHLAIGEEGKTDEEAKQEALAEVYVLDPSQHTLHHSATPRAAPTYRFHPQVFPKQAAQPPQHHFNYGVFRERQDEDHIYRHGVRRGRRHGEANPPAV